MNVHESARLRHMLCTNGLEIAKSPDTANILIFQTCSIRDTAAQKIITHIHQAKKQKPKPQICVIGCLSAHTKIDGVDIQLGTNQLELLVEKLCQKKPDMRFGIENSIIITHGCENFCTYCIVPYVRGKEYSRDIDDIVNEFEQIKNCGKVIYLLGKNVNSYRCPRTKTNFVGLLDQLCKIDGDFILNFMSSHPKDFTYDLIDCIARNSKIERNIHLPLQSGCNKILAAMNRGYTIEQYTEKINCLRERIPGVHITTDIICGFPGESEQDFDKTINVIKAIRFNAAFIFAYSAREGTTAAKLDGQLDMTTKRQRATKLIQVQRKISASHC